MVVAEAMSYGVPVLCYENEGPGELTPAASSLKVPYKAFNQNIKDFAERLRWLHDSPRLLAAEAALSRRHVAQHHTWERRTTSDGGRYRHCRECGLDDDGTINQSFGGWMGSNIPPTTERD